MPLPPLYSREDIVAHWQAAGAEAPYRASVDLDAEWMADGVLPRALAEAGLTVGERRILAFRHAEVRDFFVEANLDKGARAEPDGADRAAQEVPPIKEAVTLATLAEAVAANLAAREASRSAEDRVRSAFIVEMEDLLARGRIPEALGIIRSIPSSTSAMRTIGLMKAVDAGWNPNTLPLHNVDSTPLTAERGRVLFEQEQANRKIKAAEDAITHFVEEPLRDLIAAKDLEGAEALVEQIKPSMAAAYAGDAVWCMRREIRAGQEDASDEPASTFKP